MFNNYKNSNYKKLSTKIRNIFVSFQAPFSKKIINIDLYKSYKAFIRSIV